MKSKRTARAVALASVLVLTASLVQAAVVTDKYDYVAGETVQITGDSMAPSEGVSVDVSFPDGTLAQHHEVVADEAGNFADTYVITDSAPSGIYTVLATGLSSGTVFTTTFDPAVQADCLQFDNGAVFDPVTPVVTAVSGGIRIDWEDQCSDEDGYDVLRSTDGITWTTIATVDPVTGQGTTATNTDTSAVCGTTYYYQIRAFRSSGTQSWESFSEPSGAISRTDCNAAPDNSISDMFYNVASSGPFRCHSDLGGPPAVVNDANSASGYTGPGTGFCPGVTAYGTSLNTSTTYTVTVEATNNKGVVINDKIQGGAAANSDLNDLASSLTVTGSSCGSATVSGLSGGTKGSKAKNSNPPLSNDSNVITWTINNMADGQVCTLTFRVTKKFSATGLQPITSPWSEVWTTAGGISTKDPYRGSLLTNVS
jgi:hypothetical protein